MTISAVRSAWNTNVFQHATVQAMTGAILDDGFTAGSKTELSRLKDDQLIHFIQFIVTKAEIPGLIGARQYRYNVELSYYIQADTDGDNYTAAIDNLETIDGLINSELGVTWDGTVDLMEEADVSLAIEQIEIEGLPVWRFTQPYTAIKIQ